MLNSVLSDTPSEELKGGDWADGWSMEDMTPELGVERGFYQRDINSVCNASLRLPLRSLKGAGSEIGAPYQVLQNWGLQKKVNHYINYQFDILFKKVCEHAAAIRKSYETKCVLMFTNM